MPQSGNINCWSWVFWINDSFEPSLLGNISTFCNALLSLLDASECVKVNENCIEKALAWVKCPKPIGRHATMRDTHKILSKINTKMQMKNLRNLNPQTMPQRKAHKSQLCLFSCCCCDKTYHWAWKVPIFIDCGDSDFGNFCFENEDKDHDQMQSWWTLTLNYWKSLQYVATLSDMVYLDFMMMHSTGSSILPKLQLKSTTWKCFEQIWKMYISLLKR